MQYLLVENKQIVHLGPTFWRHRFIQSELEDHDIDYIVSPAEPNEYVKISDTFEIYPIESITQPAHDSTYQQLAGPFWSFDNNVAVGTYSVVDRDLNSIKNDLKSQAAVERYKKEIAGIKMTIQGTEVSVATDRESRNIYAQKILGMNGDSVQWKFNESWLTLSKEELGSLLNAVDLHVQTQYDWESRIVTQIESANSAEELKAIVIVEKTETPGVM